MDAMPGNILLVDDDAASNAMVRVEHLTTNRFDAVLLTGCRRRDSLGTVKVTI